MLGAAALAIAGCTTSGDSATPTTEPPTASSAAETTAPEATLAPGFETLPPVPNVVYPTGRDDVVLQVRGATDGPLPLPLLTVYGDRTVVAATDDGWVTGQVTESALQLFLEEVETVGLLDGELVRRDPLRTDEPPDITVVIDANGDRLRHVLDVGGIDEGEALWAFLVRSTTQNVFELTEPFVGTWITCSATELDSCREVTSPTSPSDRPVLRGESTAEVLA